MMSTSFQRQKIGYMRKLLGLNDDTYYEMLSNAYQVTSSKDLTFAQAREFLKTLRDNGKSAGVFKPVSQHIFFKYKYNNLGERDTKMATPKQLRKISAMWFKISRQETEAQKTSALEKMCCRITGKEKLQFLTKSDISKVIKAFEKMGKDKENG